MIYFVWTGKAVQDRGKELREFAIAMTKIGQKYAPEDVLSYEMVSNLTGNRTQVHLVAKCNSLSAFEAFQKKWKTDKDWIATAKKYFEDSPSPIAQGSAQIYEVQDLG